MPIPFLKEIEKFINEHGSATILRERLALADDQYSALEKRLSDFEARVKSAELATKNLESKNEALKRDNSNLRNQVRALEEKLSAGHQLTLHEIEQKIIFFLKDNPKSSIQQISTAIGIENHKVRELLDQYRIFGGAECSFDSPSGDSLWTLTY